MTVKEFYITNEYYFERLKDILDFNLNIIEKDSGLIQNNGVTSRLKTEESLEKKCEENGIAPEEIINRVFDIVGERVIVKYLDKIPELVEEIKKIPGLTIVEEKDYITNRKKSGYSAYHLKCLVSTPTKDGNKLLPAEIQIRTLSQGAWAIIEHGLRYKPKEGNSVDEAELDKRFMELAERCRAVDELVVEIRKFCCEET